MRVGIIGASASGGWAKISHVPAVKSVAGLELVAAATTNQKTADEAARAFGAKYAHGRAQDLIANPEVDLVAVCVKVPDHRELVLNALAAGKHVYCEWPLGRTLGESQEMAAAARGAGVHAAIGLQSRLNAAALRARELIAQGAIGRLLSARMYSPTAAWGPNVSAAMSFAEKPESGVNLVTIQGAHSIDFAIFVLGAFRSLSALTTTQYPEVRVAEGAKRSPRTTPDHLLLHARLENDVALSIEASGGRPVKAPFYFEAVGETGTLALEGGAERGFQAGRLRLSLNGAAEAVNEGELGALPDEAANVAALYAALRNDIERGTAAAPDFEHAVRLARLVEDVMSSSQSGERKQATAWPEHA